MKDKSTELDKWRKRLIAVIFAYYKKNNQEVTIDFVKATACRGAGESYFNHIPKTKLQSLYYAFLNKNKAINYVEDLTAEIVSEQICLN